MDNRLKLIEFIQSDGVDAKFGKVIVKDFSGNSSEPDYISLTHQLNKLIEIGINEEKRKSNALDLVEIADVIGDINELRGRVQPNTWDMFYTIILLMSYPVCEFSYKDKVLTIKCISNASIEISL